MTLSIEVTDWNNSRHLLKKMNPSLAETIDQISPDKKYKLIKLRIPFGDLIVDNGKFNINLGKHQNLISYSVIPLFFVLSKNLEVFVLNNNRVIPLNMVNEGSLVGLFETVDAFFGEHSNSPWSVCSGARSILLLPKITDKLKHKNLNIRYGLPMLVDIKKLTDHWLLFKMLSQSPNFKQEWHSEILIFTNPWFDRKRNDSTAWAGFYNHIFKNAWQVLSSELVKSNIEMLWEGFRHAIADRRLKPHQYISDNIKHLMMLAAKRLPGFIPATNQIAAPINEFQRIMVEDYKLLESYPLFMHTAPLDALDGNDCIYYSLFFPTLFEGAPGTSNNKTILMDLNDIIINMETIQERGPKNAFIHNIEYNYFHTTKHLIRSIQPSSALMDYDPRFANISQNYFGRSFPLMSQFWQGCIGIRSRA